MAEQEQSFIQSLSDLDILRLAEEAARGGEELTTARNLLSHEMARRGIVEALEQTSGVYDANDGTPDAPKHIDEHWQTDFQRSEG